MSRARLLDTNLIVRHLVQDNPAQAKIAGKLFEACDRGSLVLIILSAVLAEVVFVLESFYGHPCRSIAEVLSALIASPGIKLTDEQMHLFALSEYAKGKQHFVDCLIAADAKNRNLSVATFDQGFHKLSYVKVELTD